MELDRLGCDIKSSFAASVIEPTSATFKIYFNCLTVISSSFLFLQIPIYMNNSHSFLTEQADRSNASCGAAPPKEGIAITAISSFVNEIELRSKPPKKAGNTPLSGLYLSFLDIKTTVSTCVEWQKLSTSRIRSML